MDRLKDKLTPGVDKVKSPTGRLRDRGATQAKKYAEVPEDDDDEDEDEEDEDDEDESEEEDEPMNDFDEIGAEAEGSDEDAEGESDEDNDVEMEEPTLPLPPKITLKQTPIKNGKLSKPTLIVTPAIGGPVKSVEDKEMEVEEDDVEEEELSELEDDNEEEQDETNLGEDDLEGEEDAEGEIDLDSDADTPGSGANTPSFAEATKRQRGTEEGLMALDMAPQVRPAI